MDWERSNRFAQEWTDKAVASVGAGQLKVNLIEKGRVRTLVVEGSCPRCDDPIHATRELTAVGPFRGLRRRKTTTPVPIGCNCANPHQDQPEGSSGCGIYFNVAVPAG